MTLKDLLARLTGLENGSAAKDSEIAALKTELATIKGLLSPKAADPAKNEDESEDAPEVTDEDEGEPAVDPEGDDEDAPAKPAKKASGLAAQIARLIAENKVLKAASGSEAHVKALNAAAARLIAANGFDHPVDTVKGSKKANEAKAVSRAELAAMKPFQRLAHFRAGGKISE